MRRRRMISLMSAVESNINLTEWSRTNPEQTRTMGRCAIPCDATDCGAPRAVSVHQPQTMRG